jgi:hypothetical protein
MRKATIGGSSAGVAEAGENLPSAGSDLEQAPAEIAEYAESLKKLTNQEVSERLESATQAVTPSMELDEITWWRIRALLDELHWRLSGLE